MFNKADAEKFVKEEKKDIYQKIHNTVSEEELIKYKNAFENNVNRTYANMSKTIDDGLKRSVSSLIDVYNTSHSLPITTKISFFIRNISGFKAFTKIVKEYSNDYEMKVVSSNVIPCPENVLHCPELLDVNDVFSHVNDYLMDLDSNKMKSEDLIEIYKNEDDITRKVLNKLYNVNSIDVQVMFTSKFNLEDLFKDEDKQMKNEEKDAKDIFDNVGDYFDNVGNYFDNVGNYFDNVGNDFTKVVEKLFGIPYKNIKHKRGPNGYHYFYLHK